MNKNPEIHKKEIHFVPSRVCEKLYFHNVIKFGSQKTGKFKRSEESHSARTSQLQSLKGRAWAMSLNQHCESDWSQLACGRWPKWAPLVSEEDKSTDSLDEDITKGEVC